MWLLPPSPRPLPFPHSRPSRASSSPRRGCLPCWDNDSNIAVAFGIPAALVGFLAAAVSLRRREGFSARLGFAPPATQWRQWRSKS